MVSSSKYRPVYLDKQHSTLYRIYNIHAIDYAQTKFEKVFNIGHITFYGDMNKSKSEQSTDKNIAFSIYGVKNFDKNSKWMTKYIEISEEDTTANMMVDNSVH